MTIAVRGRARAGWCRDRGPRADVRPSSWGWTGRRWRSVAPPAPPHRRALAASGLHLIAEIKRSSPSAGPSPSGEDIIATGRTSGRGAAATRPVRAALVRRISSRTWRVRAAVSVPVLAKEFVVEAGQLDLLRAAGADLVLLLAVLHPGARLARLVDRALDLGLEPLVEVHDERELEAALATRARLVGINNRDLRTLKVDPERAATLRALVPEDRLVVAESGVRNPATVRSWRALGFDAVLIGEALVRAPDPEAEARAFAAAGRPPADPANLDRIPFVKICGVTDAAGIEAAVRAGADAIGLNLVPGTPRALELAEAVALAARLRAVDLPLL